MLSLGLAFALSAITSHAEDAPVYDADNFPPQFDGQSDGGADLSSPSPSQPVSFSESESSRIARLEQQLTALAGDTLDRKAGCAAV